MLAFLDLNSQMFEHPCDELCLDVIVNNDTIVIGMISPQDDAHDRSIGVEVLL